MLGIARKAASTLLVSAVLAAGLGATALAAPPDKDHKVTICHLAAKKYVKISIAKSALPAHLAHGDIETDEYGDCP